MFENKTILIYDDERYILTGLKKIIEKKFPNNNVLTFDSFTGFPDLSTVDIIIFDFYFDSKIYTPDLVKDCLKQNPNIFVIVVSGAFVTNHDSFSCIDKGVMKDCLNAGANRVCIKDSREIIDVLDKQYYYRLIKNR